MCSISSNHAVVPSTTTSIPSASSTFSSRTSSFEGLMPPKIVSLVLDYLMIGPNFTIGYDEIPRWYSNNSLDKVIIPEVVRKSLINVIKVNKAKLTVNSISFNFPEINKMIAQCKATVEFFGCNFSVYKERLLFLSHVKFKEYSLSRKEYINDTTYCLIQNLREWNNGASLIRSFHTNFLSTEEEAEVDLNKNYFRCMAAVEATQTVRALQEVRILEEKPDIKKHLEFHYLFNYEENELSRPKLVIKQLEDSDLEKDIKEQLHLKKIDITQLTESEKHIRKLVELGKHGHNLYFTWETDLYVSPFTGIMQFENNAPKPILLLKWEGPQKK